VAPDGTTTAEKLVPSASASGFKELYQGTNFVSGLPYAYSIFVKADGYSFIQLIGSAGELGTFIINFDLSTGAETQFTVGTSTISSRGITSVGNGWYRVFVVATPFTTALGRFSLNVIPTSTSARGASWTADGTSGVLVWGAQVEQR
jgi:hypothetical protein